jgi:hypothetical protein
MKHSLVAALLLVACDGVDPADGSRSPCAAGGHVLGEASCGSVDTAEDACWKLVGCGVMPIDDPDGRDWGDCVDRIEGLDAATQDVAIACVRLASCEQLIARGGPDAPWEWPDCLEYR